MMLPLVAALLSVAAPVSPPTPSPAGLAAARDLMVATDTRGQMRALMPQMATAMGVQLRRMFADQKVPYGLQRQVTAAIQADIASLPDVFTADLDDRIAAIYARHFTADDLRRLAAMMRDPVMARFRAEMPNLMGEMMPILFDAMKPQQQAFQARMRQIIADWMRQHPEDRAKLRPPTAS